MALIKCGNCGSEVSNTGKCPKCGALICQECGQVLDKIEVKCPNCGKGTVFLKRKIRDGYFFLGFCLITSWWFFAVLVDVTDKQPQLGKTSDILFIIIYVYLFFKGIYNLVKYGGKKLYS